MRKQRRAGRSSVQEPARREVNRHRLSVTGEAEHSVASTEQPGHFSGSCTLPAVTSLLRYGSLRIRASRAARLSRTLAQAAHDSPDC